MPIFGIAFFGAMLVLAFVSRPRTRMALALAGGAWAVGLVAIQAFVLGTWCKLCMVADPAAIGLALGGAGCPCRLAAGQLFLSVTTI